MHAKTIHTNHPTIGLLIEGITGPYQSGIWPGIVERARELGIRLLCYCGGSLDVSPQNPWEYQRNSLFDLAEKDQPDGYIISGSLGGYIARDRFVKFVERFRGRPAISLIPIMEDIPSVYVDNRKGMRDLLTHLIHDHHYRSFAFIRGPHGNFEAEERFQSYKELLRHFGVAFNPDTVIQGDFTRECGKKAVEYLLSRSLKVDAIIAAADEIAIGALHGLREKGMQIPGDVALAGFDDIPESAVTFPPITTIRQPMLELGKKAVELITELLKGEIVPSTTVLDATLTIRQSCGCFNHRLPLEPNALPDTRKYKTKAAGSNEHDVREILDRVDPAIREQARSIIRSFLKDVHALQSVSFLIGLDKIGSEPDAIAGKSEAWNALFSELWLFARRRFERTKMMFAEDLLHASAAIRVELEKRLQGFRTITLMRENQAVRSLGQTIANSLDIGVLFTTIVRHFPLMGIRTFFLLLYDGSSKTDANLRLKLACFNGKPMAAAALRRLSGPLMFKMHGEVTVGHPPVLIIEPLYFQKERFGMLVFEADAGGGELFDIVTGYISGALHSTFLVQKVKHQSTILGKANKELARLQVKEHAFLEAINRELDRGRRIQKGFLPQTLPQPKGWEIAASFVPARAVSGDFYDAFMLGEKHLAFAIADVSGKDVSAALFMALICTLIRILTERLFAEGVDPLNAVGIINEYVLAHYSQAKDRQMYTTLFLGLIEVDGGELHYCNAGHYPPVVVSAGSIQTHLLTTGPALGLIPGVEYKKETSVILPQTLLFAYTDGVTDARSPDGDQFTTARMFEIVKREAASASEKLTHIETALSEHTRGAEPSDDITILILRRL